MSDQNKALIFYAYAAIELLVFGSGLFDHAFIHSENPFLFEHLGAAILGFSITGLFLVLYALASRSEAGMERRLFRRCMAISLVGTVFPFVFLLYILSQLH